MGKNNLTAGLITFVEEEIMPRYEKFDKAHDRRHAFTVLSESLRLARHYDVEMDMVYVIAAYHDLGLEKGREKHHTESARIVREDERLKQFFTAEQIEIIADAVEDHRASNKHEPRTIYGKIVAEADRIIDSPTLIRRTVQYGLTHYPTLTKKEHIARAMEHIREKYGHGGYLKLWIPHSSNAARLEEFRQLIDDEKKIREIIAETYEHEKGNR